MKLGITIKSKIGIGDAVQFSSLPENYFQATGEKLIDVSRPWFFDFNPFVIRTDMRPEQIRECWNYGPKQWDFKLPEGREIPVFLSNAEVIAAAFGVPTVLNRPRFYRYEDQPFHTRELILLQIEGRSHGYMPDNIIEHILKKYGPTRRLYQIGPGKRLDIPYFETPSLWDLTKLISSARMLIGLDSGPSWIAAAYPDVIVKKVRTKPSAENFKKWVPLALNNIHSHWDDRCHQIFNPTTEDVGFTSSYLKI